MTNRDERSAKIAGLNDAFRDGRGDGRWLLTSGVNAEGPEFTTQALAAVATFTAFTSGNDPYGEHDFGSIEIDGETIFWKIDYYQAGTGYKAGAEAPENAATTDRVITIMLAEEY